MSKQLIMPERLIEPEYSERRIKQRQGQRQTDLNLQITRLQQPPQQKHLKKSVLTITPGASLGISLSLKRLKNVRTVTRSGGADATVEMNTWRQAVN